MKNMKNTKAKSDFLEIFAQVKEFPASWKRKNPVRTSSNRVLREW